MNKDLIEECLIKFTSEISSLNANMRSVLDKLTSHEQRLTNLEQNKVGLKDDFLKILVKTLTISVVGLIVLGGGGAIIVKALPLLAI